MKTLNSPPDSWITGAAEYERGAREAIEYDAAEYCDSCLERSVTGLCQLCGYDASCCLWSGCEGDFGLTECPYGHRGPEVSETDSGVVYFSCLHEGCGAVFDAKNNVLEDPNAEVEDDDLSEGQRLGFDRV